MPFTPFHFGLGLAVKAAIPRSFHLGVFVGLQVVTDLESLYNLVYDRHPVHRFLHMFAGASLLGIAGSVVAIAGWLGWWRVSGRGPGRPNSSKRLFASLFATALFATESHVLLDGIMHRDARPFWPVTEANPLLRCVGFDALHGGLVTLGIVGLVVLGYRWAPAGPDG